MTDLFNIIKLNDAHVPFEDKEAVACAFRFCKDKQPNIIVIDEWHDFYSVSRFDKNPERINSLQDELDQVEKYFGQLRKSCPDSRIILLESNHLRRLKKFLWKKAPELACLRALEIESLLGLKKYNIEFMDVFVFRGVYMFKHGDIIRKQSAYTARAELEREGVAGASGHSHRLGKHYKRMRGGKYVWMECGCLCNLNPEWFEGVPDWEQGIGVVSFKGNTKHYIAHELPITDYEILSW